MKRKAQIYLLCLVAVLVVAAWLLPLKAMVYGLQNWVDSNRQLSLLFMTLFASLAIVVMFPSSINMMLSGFLFGLGTGFAVMWTAVFFGSTAAFLIGRTLARPLIERKIEGNDKLLAIDRAIRRKGFFVVLLTRLIMVLPFPALNYSHGLTNVRLGDYIFGTMIGMIFPTLLFVWFGTLASNVADILSGRMVLDGNHLALIVAGSVALLALVAIIVFSARKALAKELERESEPRV